MNPDVLGRVPGRKPGSMDRLTGSSGAASSTTLRLSSGVSRLGGRPGLTSGCSILTPICLLTTRSVACLGMTEEIGGGRTSCRLLEVAELVLGAGTKYSLRFCAGGWNLGFMSSRMGGGEASGSGELGSLLGGVLNGDTLSSAGSTVLLGASESLTCLVLTVLLNILGFPARFMGGGSCVDGMGLSGSACNVAGVVDFKIGVAAGLPGDVVLGGGTCGGSRGRGEGDRVACALLSCGPASVNGVIGRRSEVFGGDRGDSTMTFGGDRGGESGPMEIGRGLDGLLEGASGASLSFPSCLCTWMPRPSRGGEFRLDSGRGMSNEKRPSRRERIAS